MGTTFAGRLPERLALHNSIPGGGGTPQRHPLVVTAESLAPLQSPALDSQSGPLHALAPYPEHRDKAGGEASTSGGQGMPQARST